MRAPPHAPARAGMQRQSAKLHGSRASASATAVSERRRPTSSSTGDQPSWRVRIERPVIGHGDGVLVVRRERVVGAVDRPAVVLVELHVGHAAGGDHRLDGERHAGAQHLARGRAGRSSGSAGPRACAAPRRGRRASGSRRSRRPRRASARRGRGRTGGGRRRTARRAANSEARQAVSRRRTSSGGSPSPIQNV